MLVFKSYYKQYLVLTVCAFLTIVVCGQYSVIVKGVIKGVGNKRIYLGNKKSGIGPGFIEVFYDSTVANNDSFQFNSHNFRYFNDYSIEVQGQNGWKTFIIDTGNISIEGKYDSIWKSKVIGSANNDFFSLFNKQIYFVWEMKNRKLWDSISKQTKHSENRKKQIFDSLLLPINNEYIDTIKKLTISESKKNSYLAYRIFNYLPLNSMPLDSLRFYFSQLSHDVQNYPELEDLKYKVGDFEKNISVGSYMPTFTLLTTDLKQISKIPDHGKIRLLNFWASWCGPCLNEIPQLDSIQKIYEKSNFSIVSISIDEKITMWKSKLKQFSFPTYHLVTDSANNSTIIKYFRIFSIPFGILIDENDRIIKYNIELKDIGKEIKRRTQNSF